MKSCEVCGEDLIDGWESCWKCSSSEVSSEKNSNLSEKLIHQIGYLSSLSVILIVLSICGSFYYIFENWKYLSYFHIGSVVLTSGVWCYFLLGITRLVESVVYLYKNNNTE